MPRVGAEFLRERGTDVRIMRKAREEGFLEDAENSSGG